MKKILYFIALGIGLLTACKKGTLVETTVYEKIDQGSTQYSYLKLLNVSPGTPTVNFYLDGNKYSALYTSLGKENGGYGYDASFPSLGYAIAQPGSHVLTASTLASAAVDPALQVFNTTITPEGGKYYSIIATGVYDAVAKKIPTALVLTDVRPATDTTKIFVRFVNLFNSGPNVDLIQASDGSKIASNVGFGTASSWVTIPNPGQSNKYTFANSGTGVLLTGSLTVAFTKGRAYTVYVYGSAAGTAFPLKADYYTTFY